MSRGRRFDEPKLNMKKVFAVILAIIVIIMFIFMLSGILNKGQEQVKITSQSYYVSFKDNKWGVIDASGNDVIEPSYQEMIIIPNHKKDVFLCTYDVNYETEEYKTKVLNSKNEEIFTQYEQIEAIANNDESENLWYEENVLKIKSNGKQGAIDLTGKEIIPCEYEEIQAIKGIENALLVKKDGKYGVYDAEGKKILEPQYQEIINLGKDNKAGYIVKNEQGSYGIVDYTNNSVLPLQYEAIEKVYGNGFYVIQKSGKPIVINKEGTEVLKDGFDKVVAILKNTQEPGIIYQKDGKYGVMKQDGQILIQPIYEDIKEAKEDIFIAKQNGKYGIVDKQNTTQIDFIYEKINYYEKADIYIADDEKVNSHILDQSFAEKQVGILMEMNEEKGYFKIRQAEETRYYNFKFEEKKVTDVLTSNNLFLSKKDGKYGLVDKNGKTVVEYNYDDATEQNECGYVAVKKDGKWGAIDNRGNIVVEPTYQLDDYLLIDFIGKWHLGKDINMNYYNQK